MNMTREEDLERIIYELSSLNPEELARIMAERPEIFHQAGLYLVVDDLEKAVQVFPQFYDMQTGLMSKHYFEENLLPSILQEAASKNMPVCYSILDIDNFKDFNEKYGHDIGDKVLELVSDKLKELLRYSRKDRRLGQDRRHEKLVYETEKRKTERRTSGKRRVREVHDYVYSAEVGRVGGGEEFGVLLCGCDSDQTFSVLDRIRQIISNSYVKMGYVDLGVTISGGYAQYSPGMGVEQLIRNAYKALLEAKQRGKNVIVGYAQPE